MNPHTQYLASNSKQLEQFIFHRHTELGHDIKILLGDIGECIGYMDINNGDRRMIEWR